MDINITVKEVHLHYPVDPRLERVERKIDVLLANTEKIIMANAETKAILTKIDNETTRVGEKVAELLATVSTSMTAAEVAEVNAAGQAIVDRLTAIAADPDNPVPVEPVG